MKTMRKTTILKITTTVVAMLFALNGLFAQNPPVPYALYDANKTAPTNIEYLTLKTGGTSMGYYALPDPVYHPTYVATGALTGGFVWNWTLPTNPGGSVTYPVGGFPANYVQINYTATGNYVVNVQEQASPAFGSCVSAVTTVMNTTVIAPPTAVFTTADNTANCGNLAAQPLSITFTENIALALAGYSFRVRETVQNIDAVGAPVGVPTINDNFVNFPLAGKAQNGTAGFAGGLPTYTYGFNSAALNIVGAARTRYTYELISAVGVTGTGVVSAISHKSDYLASPVVNGYAFGAKTTVVFIVNPAPVTGPIYHIPNAFNL